MAHETRDVPWPPSPSERSEFTQAIPSVPCRARLVSQGHQRPASFQRLPSGCGPCMDGRTASFCQSLLLRVRGGQRLGRLLRAGSQGADSEDERSSWAPKAGLSCGPPQRTALSLEGLSSKPVLPTPSAPSPTHCPPPQSTTLMYHVTNKTRHLTPANSLSRARRQQHLQPLHLGAL